MHTDTSLKIMLVGNKGDLESSRGVPIEEGQELSEQEKMFFTETSAFNGENVDKAFLQILHEVYNENAAKKVKDGEIGSLGGIGSASMKRGKPLLLNKSNPVLPPPQPDSCTC